MLHPTKNSHLSAEGMQMDTGNGSLGASMRHKEVPHSLGQGGAGRVLRARAGRRSSRLRGAGQLPLKPATQCLVSTPKRIEET